MIIYKQIVTHFEGYANRYNEFVDYLIHQVRLCLIFSTVINPYI